MNAASKSWPVEVVRLTAGDWAELREVRLRALRDAPTAFCSSHVVESKFSDREWQDKAEKWTEAGRCATWAVRQDDLTAGLVACVIDQDHDRRAWLISMWVDPACRGHGFAMKLIDAAVGWAQHRGLDEVRLHVTSNNDAARRLYERQLFVTTGESMPHPRVADLVEHEMRRSLVTE